MLIGIISDTHIRKNEDFSGLLKHVKKAFEGVDLIIHAGDVCNITFLNALGEIAPIEAVCGNSDDSTIYDNYEPVKILEIEGAKIAISHQEISPSFIQQEQIKIIVNGHTHIPEIKEIPGVLMLNPGSPTHPRSPPIRKMYQKRRLPLPSVILLEIEDGISTAYIYSFNIS